MITKTFNTKHQLLEVVLEGTISIEEMLEYFQGVLNDSSIPRNLKILEDGRAAEFAFSLPQNQEFRSLLIENIGRFDYIRAAHVQTKVIETAYTLEFELKNELPNYNFKVFHEYQNAFNWLLHDT